MSHSVLTIGELAASIARDLNEPRVPDARARSVTDVPANLNRLLEHYEALLRAAKGKPVMAELVAKAEATRAQVNEQVVLNLCKLLVALSDFGAESKLPPGKTSDSPSDRYQKLVSALQETIEVLTRTKRSFKSSALGNLRAKLEKLVEPGI